MDIIERLDAAIKTEDFWVGDQREDNILKDSKKIIEQLRNSIQEVKELLINLSNYTNPRTLAYGIGRAVVRLEDALEKE
jgi:hypothetical protein